MTDGTFTITRERYWQLQLAGRIPHDYEVLRATSVDPDAFTRTYPVDAHRRRKLRAARRARIARRGWA